MDKLRCNLRIMVSSDLYIIVELSSKLLYIITIEFWILSKYLIWEKEIRGNYSYLCELSPPYLQIFRRNVNLLATQDMDDWNKKVWGVLSGGGAVRAWPPGSVKSYCFFGFLCWTPPWKNSWVRPLKRVWPQVGERSRTEQIFNKQWNSEFLSNIPTLYIFISK